jgi:hypothetical protein
MTILVNQHNLIIRRDRYNVDPVAAFQDKEIVFPAIARRAIAVFAQREDTAGVDGLGAETLPGVDGFVKAVSHQSTENVKRAT